VRTTLSIDDQLLAAAKEAARRRGYTLGELVEDALRRALSEPAGGSGPQLPLFDGGTGPRPGVPLRSNRALLEFLENEEADTAK
jgi:Arc/MetJ family transcription regulator